ncbi:MAG: RNA polymerase sigma factor [Akkermansia sp.]|nr:RNA polymerase sigma factor [Akkermansia sp.]
MKTDATDEAEPLPTDGFRSWESWLAEHGDRLLLYARQRTRSEADAEDVLQSALLSLVRVVGRGSFRKGPEQWPAYVISCIRNAAADLYRARVRHTASVQAVAMEQETECEDKPWLRSADDAELRRVCVERVLRNMRPDYAEVVVLHVWERMTFREIAETLGEKPATVASRYRAALRIFRKLVESELNPAR